jgi:polar amino acid transport system permease protein
MNALAENFFNPAIIEQAWMFLLDGLVTTIGLSLLIIPLGLSGGAGLAFLDALQWRWLSRLLRIYIDLFRALPPLVLLILIYYGVPFTGLDLPRIAAVAITFLLHASSYFGEIFRAGVASVPAGQWEAARATGLSRSKAFVYVIFPQAARNVVPDLVSNSIEAIKLTSIASVVALPELLYNARQAQAMTYNPTPIIMAGLVYLMMLWPLIRLLARLEHPQNKTQ